MHDRVFDENGNYSYPWEVNLEEPNSASGTGQSFENYMDLGVVDGDTVRPTPKAEDLKSNFHNPFQPEGYWTADNKTDNANLDVIDNKADPGPRGKEKITPIAEEGDEEIEPDISKKNDKFNDIYINKDVYHKITKALNDYKSLIHKELSRLSSYHYSNSKDILKLAEALIELDKTINLVRDTFRPNSAPVVLDEINYLMNWDEWRKNHSDENNRNAVDDEFLMKQLEKAMQSPGNQAKIWNAMLSANVYKKDIMVEEKEKKK